MKIEDILTNKGREKKTNKKHQLQKSSFNVDKTTPEKAAKSDKPDISDPNFWQKIGLPFEGFSSKQLLKQYKSRRNAITSTLESQQKFTKEVTRCVNGVLDAKLADDSRTIDEEIYDLL